MIKKIVSILFVAMMLVAPLFAFFPQQTQANATYVPWYNSSWLYRKSFNVIGSADGTQTNYQLKVYAYYGAGTDTGFVLREPVSSSYSADAGTDTTTIVDSALTSTVDSYYVGAKVYNSTRSLWAVVTAYVAATKTLTISPAIAAQTTADLYYLSEIPPVMYFNSKSKADFSDLIFTRNDGTTALDYYLSVDEGYVASSYVIVYVEFNTITAPPTTNTFWVYYGNPAATSVSNIGNTFIFGDDFNRANNAAVDNGWTESETGGTCAISSNTLIITYVGAGALKCAHTLTGLTPMASMITSVQVNNATGTGRITYSSQAAPTTTASHRFGSTGANNIDYLNSAGDTWIDTGSNFTINVYDKFEIISKSITGVADYKINDGATWSLNNYAMADLGTNTIEFGEGLAAGTITVNYVFFRNWTTNEPRWSTFTTEAAVGATQTIQDVTVFNSYLVTGDWLFAIRYLDVYYPYYDTADIRQYFVFQLCNLAGTVIAQTPVLSWGNKPGSLYISPALAGSLEWGQPYTVRIYGLMSGNPTTTWTLTSANWAGSELTNLDSWVLSSVGVIENYYYVQPSTTSTTSGSTTTTTSGTLSAPSATALINKDLTTYVSGRGQVLNSVGGAVFELGIPGLSHVRPTLFQTYTTPGISPTGTFQQTYRQQLGAWQTNIGVDGTVMLTRIGNLFGITGNIVVIIIMMIFILIVAAVAFPMGHTTASLVLCILMLFSIVFWGLDTAWLVIITVVSGFLLFKQFIIDKGN